MMSLKQWSALLCFQVSYLFLGASIFYHIENPLELERKHGERQERFEILSLINHHLASKPEAKANILNKLSDYCQRTMANTTESEEPGPIWDFFHSFFFSYTVISTIGYGNIAPTSTLGRMIMIFYALVGIPINGILFANLGDYFGNTFRRLYQKYKLKNPESGSNIDYQFRRLGLVGQIAVYLLPGILFFIFMPACLFVIFEGWDYPLAVYYAFVTLTTIGFGDYVASYGDYSSHTDFAYNVYLNLYKAFIIFWITFGLGYLVMVVGFLTQGLKSERMKKLEHMVAQNIKETQSKIWHGVTKDVGYLRKLLNEVYMMRYKPVYRDEIPPPKIHRSSSCPSLSLEKEDADSSPRTRRRANSEAYSSKFPELHRIQSETDLLAIDRNKTFAVSSLLQPAELLAKVVDALGETMRSEENPIYEEGIHGFSDEDILASERTGSTWSVGGGKMYSMPPKIPRGRAASEIRIPSDEKLYNSNELTWTGSDYGTKIKMMKARRLGKMSVPNVKLASKIDSTETDSNQTRTLFSKLNPFKSQQPKIAINDIDVNEKQIEMSPADYLKKTARGRVSYAPTTEMRYINKTGKGRQSNVSLPPNTDILEQTSVADLIRALTVLHSSSPEQPKRKLGTASLTPPRIPSVLDLFPPTSSMTKLDERRRLSVHPIISTPVADRRQSGTPTLPPAAARRRFSLHPASTSSSSFTSITRSPVVGRPNKIKRDLLAPPPPPYSTHTEAESPSLNQLNKVPFYDRRLSLISTPSPRSRRFQLPLSIRERRNNIARTRHESLTEIKIEDSDSDQNKQN